MLSVSSGNIPICFSCAPFLFTPPSRPPPIPSPESGRPPCHHSPLSDNWYKGGLGGHGCGRSMCTATGERVEESPPPLPIPSSPPSSSPPQMMKTLSVWIRKERCASAEGIIVLKAMPPHLCMSIPLSTYNFSLYTNFGIPNLFMPLLTL